MATITLHRAAVVHRHKITDLAHPADSKDVRDAMRYLEESLGRQQKQAKPCMKRPAPRFTGQPKSPGAGRTAPARTWTTPCGAAPKT